MKESQVLLNKEVQSSPPYDHRDDHDDGDKDQRVNHHQQQQQQENTMPLIASGYGSLLERTFPSSSSSTSSSYWNEENNNNSKEQQQQDKDNGGFASSYNRFGSFWKRRILMLSLLLNVILLLLMGVFIVRGIHHENHGATTRSQEVHLQEEDHTTATAIMTKNNEYDYIVVGAGPAGIIVATDLAKKFPQLRVLLIESGTQSQTQVLDTLRQHQQQQSSTTTSTSPPQRSRQTLNAFDVPLLWSGVAGSSGLTGSSSVHNISTGISSLEGNLHHWPIAKTLLGRAVGGSGVHNAMIYVRALPFDFDQNNIDGWSWKDLLPHYQSMERFVSIHNHPNNKSDSDPQHVGTEGRLTGFDGPVTTMSYDDSDSGNTATGTNDQDNTSFMDSIAPLFVQSAVAAGYQRAAPGFNHASGARRIGAGHYEFNIRNGIRDSIAQAYLGAQQSLPSNLHIQSGATVLRVLTTTNNNMEAPQTAAATFASPRHVQALGVEYVSEETGQIDQFLLKQQPVIKKQLNHHLRDANSDTHEATMQQQQQVQGEVILSAGAILTPQILSNSGIANKGHTLHLPGVGQNLQDHPVLAMAFALDSHVAAQSPTLYTIAQELIRYHQQHEKEQQQDGADQTGNVCSPIGTAGFGAGAFLRSPWATTPKDGSRNETIPDIQLTVFPRIVEPHVLWGACPHDQVGELSPFHDSNDDNNSSSTHHGRGYSPPAMLVTVALLRPEARYKVKPSTQQQQQPGNNAKGFKLQTTGNDADEETMDSFRDSMNRLFGLPSIELPDNATEYLTELDVKRLAWGMEHVRKIQQAPPLSNHTGDELFPGKQVQGAALHQHIRMHHMANSHWVGSTRMGSSNHQDGSITSTPSVVNERLLVHATQNLRIVDAGVLPHVPNGNTHSTVCVVAKHAAQIMAQDRQHGQQE